MDGRDENDAGEQNSTGRTQQEAEKQRPQQ